MAFRVEIDFQGRVTDNDGAGSKLKIVISTRRPWETGLLK